MGTVQIVREIDETEFWSNIMGSGWESFGSWWVSEDYISGDWETPGEVTLTIADPENEDTVVVGKVTLPILLQAYNDLWAKVGQKGSDGMHPDYLDIDNLDCVGGDGILQQAILGGVIYG
jgi:hypothetical protein